jgi:hypothetical protein
MATSKLFANKIISFSRFDNKKSKKKIVPKKKKILPILIA